MEVTYLAKTYSPELVTGAYVRCEGKKPNYQFKVFETATCWQKGRFYGKAGMGYTLREYITKGEEIPEEVKAKAIETKTTVQWR